MLSGRVIEKCVREDINGNDIGAGFEKEWLQMLEGTKERVDEMIEGVQRNLDTIDLQEGFHENEKIRLIKLM